MKEGFFVAIGSACIDEYYSMKEEFPIEGEKGLVVALGSKPGGMIANAASVLAGYGSKVYLVDSMSNSVANQNLKTELNNWGVDTDYIIEDDSLPDGRCFIFITNREKTIFVVDRGDYKRALNPRTKDLLFNAKCLYTSFPEFKRFYDYLNLAQELRNAGVELAFDMEVSTFDDYSDPLFKYASYLFFNKMAIEKYLRGKNEQQIIRELLKLGVKTVVVTKASDGCSCDTLDEHVDLPGVKVKVVDTTGAGDTFNSSFLYCLSKGLSLLDCAKFANAAGANCVTALGARSGVRSEEFVNKLVHKYYG